MLDGGGLRAGSALELRRNFLHVSFFSLRFLSGGPWIILGSHEGFYKSIIDFHSFWSILGEFWAAILEPVWRPRRLKMGKTSIFVQFLRASKRKAVSETILG